MARVAIYDNQRGLMKSKGVNIYGILTAIASGISNLLQIFWLIWLTAEQVKNGFGHGTDMDILAIVPILMNIIAIPSIIASMIFFMIHIFKKSSKNIFVINLVFWIMLLIQIGLIQLFINY